MIRCNYKPSFQLSMVNLHMPAALPNKALSIRRKVA